MSQLIEQTAGQPGQHLHALATGMTAPSGRGCRTYRDVLSEPLLQAVRDQASALADHPENFWLPLVR